MREGQGYPCYQHDMMVMKVDISKNLKTINVYSNHYMFTKQLLPEI